MKVAHHYFQSHHDYFWELYYADFGDTDFIFEIPEGGTIAYVKLVEEIIIAIADESLPPFGSLLMAIAATNFEPQGTLHSIKQILKAKEVKRAFPNVNLYNVDSAFVFLNKLVQLPVKYKSDVNRKLVFQTIFKDCHNRTSRDAAKNIARVLLNGRTEFYQQLEKNPFNESVFHKDIKTLSLLNNSFPTVNSIIKAMEGLPDEELTEELESEMADQEIFTNDPKDFVDQLIEDNKTFHVGSLIKRLWSGLRIPLHHNLPSNQPLGGISDITNKGDFDKLLISEFANDDLVFMSRIANNEALYIEREVPPEEDKFTRDIIIDSSLKNWGNPKTIAFATALAIAKHPKSDINCQLFTIGEECIEVEYETVHQVIDGINLLSGKLDASQGLTNYFEDFKGDSEKEVLLILSEDSFKLTAFQKVLHENFDAIQYIFLTTSDGGIHFFKIANKGRKLIQKIQLPLDELWNRKSAIKTSVVNSNEQLPILYPFALNKSDVFSYGTGFYNFLNGSLFQFTSKKFEKGLEKVAGNIPFRKGKYALTINSNEEKLLVNIFNKEQTISIYNISRKTLEVRELPFDKREQDLDLFPVKNNVYLTDKIKYWKILDSGKLEEVNASSVKAEYELYTRQLIRFCGNYSRSKKKHSILKRMKDMYIISNKSEIEINEFSLFYDRFKKNTYDSENFFIYVTSQVNLILKHTHTNKIGVIQFLKEELKIGLKEAKEIVDGDLSILARGITIDQAEDLKERIEDLQAICYIEFDHFLTKDGSIVTVDNGMLRFISSSAALPNFYIPFITNQPTAFATDEEFAGNEYFLPANSDLRIITVEEFHLKYYQPFIQHILKHEIDTETT